MSYAYLGCKGLSYRRIYRGSATSARPRHPIDRMGTAGRWGKSMPDWPTAILAQVTDLGLIIKTLATSGAWGILSAILLLGLIAIFGMWRMSERELKAEIRRATEALHLSTAAIEDFTSGRQSLVSAFERSHEMGKETLGRLERWNALADETYRRLGLIEDVSRSSRETRELAGRLVALAEGIEKRVDLLDRRGMK